MVSVLLTVVLALSGLALADDTTQPAPSLEQLSLETQRIYRRVRVDLIRVQLPTPDWLRSINEQRALMQKWGGRLTPQVRQLLVDQQQQLAGLLRGENGLVAEPPATTATSTTTQTSTTQPTVALPPTLDPRLVRSRLVLVSTGLIIDSNGDAVLPAYIDPQTLGGRSLRVATGDGRVTVARLVGSDRLSKLSVLQVDLHDLQPAVLSPNRPTDGSLVVALSGDGAGRLVIWNSQEPDPGVIVQLDGTVAGFSANGRLLAATACRPIVEQILTTGTVRRAVLGVRVREVSADEMQRRRAVERTSEPAVPWPADAGESAMEIDAVEPDSAAARAGLLRGDLILTAGGQAVEDTATFAALIATERGPTELTVLRVQQLCSVNVNLVPPP